MLSAFATVLNSHREALLKIVYETNESSLCLFVLSSMDWIVIGTMVTLDFSPFKTNQSESNPSSSLYYTSYVVVSVYLRIICSAFVLDFYTSFSDLGEQQKICPIGAPFFFMFLCVKTDVFP